MRENCTSLTEEELNQKHERSRKRMKEKHSNLTEEKVNQRMKLLTSTFLKSVFTDWKGVELRLLFFPEINEQTIIR
jgi:hypothetical protein